MYRLAIGTLRIRGAAFFCQNGPLMLNRPPLSRLLDSSLGASNATCDACLEASKLGGPVLPPGGENAPFLLVKKPWQSRTMIGTVLDFHGRKKRERKGPNQLRTRKTSANSLDMEPYASGQLEIY